MVNRINELIIEYLSFPPFFIEHVLTLLELWYMSIILTHQDILSFPVADMSQESAWKYWALSSRWQDGRWGQGGRRDKKGMKIKWRFLISWQFSVISNACSFWSETIQALKFSPSVWFLLWLPSVTGGVGTLLAARAWLPDNSKWFFPGA